MFLRSGRVNQKGLLSSVLIIFILISFLSCSEPGKVNPENDSEPAKENLALSKPPSPIGFMDVVGRWKLKYANHYGYDFRFYKNYKALVILYLSNHALVFKGVYTIEDNNRLKINIYEMKRDKNVRRVNVYGGFIKAKSSYFLFQASLPDDKRKKVLVVRPLKIVIDGNNSDGYFEPVIRLKHN